MDLQNTLTHLFLMDNSKVFSGITQVSNQFDGILLDAYGVFWAGNDLGLFPGSKEAMEKLILKGKIVGILSNSTQLAAKEIDKLNRQGLIQGKHFHFLITSGEVARYIFLEKELPFETPKSKFYVFGGGHPKFSAHEAIFEGTSFTETNDIYEADFLYIAIPHIEGKDQVDVEVFREEVSKLIPLNLPMICANPDHFAHEGNPPRAVVRQGSIAALYENMGGRVFYIGKPHNKAYLAAMDHFGKHGLKEIPKILMVGDTPETDIRGANLFGMPSALLIETGIMGSRVCSLGLEQALEELLPLNTPDYFLGRLIDDL